MFSYPQLHGLLREYGAEGSASATAQRSSKLRLLIPAHYQTRLREEMVSELLIVFFHFMYLLTVPCCHLVHDENAVYNCYLQEIAHWKEQSQQQDDSAHQAAESLLMEQCNPLIMGELYTAAL